MSDREARKRMHVGGQAIIEGVMMRTPVRIATAVRNVDGTIISKAESFTSLTKRYRILNIPIIRGAITLIETFVIAVKALSYSADQAGNNEDKKNGKEGSKRKSGEGDGNKGNDARVENSDSGSSGRKGDSNLHMVFIVTVALVLGFTVFFYIPLKLTELLGFEDGVLFNLVDGVFRLCFIVLYIFLITRWKEMQRVFEYHGAEHKTIFAFEEGGDVTVEKALKYPRVHPRCSTSFLLLVVIVSIALFIILGRPDSIVDRVVRFSFIPVIGGVSYELLKLSVRPAVKRHIGFMFMPGLLLQKLTTREPSRDQIEVAIAALNACLDDKLVET